MPGKRHAILVAASEFPEDSSLLPLRCPVQDVDSLGAVLRDAKHGGFEDVHILKNEPHYKIMEKVNRVIKAADQDDLVMFFYSGHGKLDQAGRLYLATVNTEVDVLESTSVPASQIKDYFDVSAARQLAIVLDCCYSGAIEKSFTKGSVDDQLNLMSGGKGTYVLTASTGLQTAKENEGDDQSVFTKHLINGIVTGDADADQNGTITLNELYKYAFREVQKDSHQKPMKWDMNVEGELIVAHSGKSRWREQRDIVHDKLLVMGTERTIPSSVLTAALSLSEKKPMDVSEHEKAQYDLLARFAKEDMKSGVFVEAWLNAKREPEPEIERKPEPEPHVIKQTKPDPVQDKPNSAFVQKDKPEVKTNAVKEFLICFAAGFGGFIIITTFVNLADLDGYGDFDTIIGALFLGLVTAAALLYYTYSKRKDFLPTSGTIQYVIWAVLYFMVFMGIFDGYA